MTSPEEIWSVRLQRELLALTASKTETNGDKEQKKDSEEPEASSTVTDDPATADTTPTKDDASTPTKKVSPLSVGDLPPFITVEKHILEIERGVCQVWFNMEVKPDEIEANGATSPTKSTVPENEQDEMKEEAQNSSTDAAEDDNTTSKEEEVEKEESKDQKQPSSVIVTIIVDASFQATRNKGRLNDSKNANTPNTQIDASLCYPFLKPIASLAKGANLLPSGSTLQNGDVLSIDCDWTPSLHLSDAALNVALKLRESIKRGEPIQHIIGDDEKDYGQALVAGLDAAASDVSDVISQGVTQSSNNIRSFITSVRNKAQTFADELDKAAVANETRRGERQQEQTQRRMEARREKMKKKKVIDTSNVEIGDVIDLSRSPWSDSVGLHSCKAIRRPEFVEAAMTIANEARNKRIGGKVSRVCKDDDDEEKDYVSVGREGAEGQGMNERCTSIDNPMFIGLQAGSIRKVAGTGLSVTGSVFQSFRAQAKSLVEESFLMLTQELLLEISCNKFSVASATVTYAVPVSSLGKLKFRRNESISLFFRQSLDDPAIYMCQSSAEAVKELQGILKQHGVRGKHTNAMTQKYVTNAMEMFTEVRVLEKVLETGDLSREDGKQKVMEIMDLYRQAAEKFEIAGDERHEEIMKCMHEFLAKPMVAKILDSTDILENTMNKAPTTAVSKPIPEGEVLEGNGEDVDDDFKNNIDTEGSDDFHQAMQAAEDMLKNAHSDLKDLGIDDIDVEEDDFGIDLDNKDSGGNDDADVVTEFESMLKDADKELAELMDA